MTIIFGMISVLPPSIRFNRDGFFHVFRQRLSFLKSVASPPLNYFLPFSHFSARTRRDHFFAMKIFFNASQMIKTQDIAPMDPNSQICPMADK